MPWHRGDSPISAAPEYEDYLFEQWSHGIFDDYWKQPGLYPEGFHDRYADVPIVHLSGWYDPYARTAMENYVGLSRAKRSRMQLVLGPWTHGDRSLSHAGEVEFGLAAPVDANLAEDFFEVRRRWFDHWIKGLANGIDEEPPGRVFAMGGGSGGQSRRPPRAWRALAQRARVAVTADPLDPALPACRPQPFCRASGGGLGRGRLCLRSA
jgi:putative CocE/NonD family hydrolase